MITTSADVMSAVMNNDTAYVGEKLEAFGSFYVMLEEFEEFEEFEEETELGNLKKRKKRLKRLTHVTKAW